MACRNENATKNMINCKLSWMTPGDTQYTESIKSDILIICFHRLPLLSQLKYLHDLSAKNCNCHDLFQSIFKSWI